MQEKLQLEISELNKQIDDKVSKANKTQDFLLSGSLIQRAMELHTQVLELTKELEELQNENISNPV